MSETPRSATEAANCVRDAGRLAPREGACWSLDGGPRRHLLPLAAIIFAAALDIVSGACLPLITRDPQVRPGLRGSVSGALPVRSHADEFGTAPIPEFGVARIAYGWASDPERKASIEVGANFFLFLPEPDLYVHLPRRATLGLDLGFGAQYATASSAVVPYAVLGGLNASGAGWVATVGHMSRARVGGYASGSDYRNVWLSSLGFQLPDDMFPRRVFLQDIHTTQSRTCFPPEPCSAPRSWSLLAGFSFDSPLLHR
jgi:hypothetical protein